MSGLLDGVLPWAFSEGDRAKRYLSGLLADPIGTAQQAAGQLSDNRNYLNGLLGQAFANQQRPFQVTDNNALAQAANSTLGGLLGFAPAGIMAGAGAATANKVALSQAQTLEAQGVEPAAIWKQTGWGKGPDGKWRFEIDDSASSFKKDAVRQLNAYGVRKEQSIFDHPALYEAYPQAGQIPVMRQTVQDTRNGVLGSYDGNGLIEMGIPRKNPDMASMRSTNLHELQHAVQGYEQFSPGGNTEQFVAGNRINPATGQAYTLEEAHNAYRSLAGEAEARMVQDRMNMTAQERRDIYPWDPLSFEFHTGVPLGSLIAK